uniref:Extracellular Endonuclease subunit A domain-containing protein n=1 Tax=Helobdella robusta TaxID=6412 RepID=T1EGT4_HELRO
MIAILSPSTTHKHHDQPPKLIVISFDGFKWDYLDFVKNSFNYSTPNFDMLISSGVSISNDGVLNAFVTKTFPNHYSIATGRYEENHGIVGNSFYDPLFNETFDISSPDGTDSKWWDGKSGKLVEPIWITNQKCGCNGTCECERYSGVVFWVGSDVEGQHPTRFLHYNKSMDFKDRLIQLLEWFTDEESPINFGMVYFNEPDSTGHEYGPNSTEIAKKIIELDKLLGEFLEMLKEKKLMSSVNIILTSDHGMVYQREVIILSDYVDVSLFQIYGTSLVYNILPKPGHLEEVYKILSNISHLNVYKKEHIPTEYHYRNNRRILDLVLTVEEGYRVCMSRNDTYCMLMKGDHGYNNSLKSMHPIFIASGPAFKVNYKLERPFEIVDLYSLMCYILKLPPHDNDGDFKRVESILNIKREVYLTENLV